ncbi:MULTISPECIES: alpha/beta hydrolase family protein [Sphingomonas]|uniref:alpha/beta hydrolase family protein n=1 Tax=Sphingomonas TaxID=13687 RepID=UPI00083282DB|nr:S9 family peptidase [Sphingomonas sp. CCH10-B3]
MVRSLVVALALLPTAAFGAPSPEAIAFGARPSVEQVSLSPDGRNLAVIAPVGARGNYVYVVNLEGPPQTKLVMRSTGSPDRLQFCRWSTNTRLICGIYFIAYDGESMTSFTRLVSIGSDGSQLKVLTARTGENALQVNYRGGEVIDWQVDGDDGKVLMTRQWIPEVTTGSTIAEQRSGLGVELVDTRTLARRTIEAPRDTVVGYISDGHGQVRIMAIRPRNSDGYFGNKTNYMYRKKGSRDWLPLVSETFTPDGLGIGFRPIAVDRDLDVAYGYDAENGHTALFKMALDGSMKRELVFARPDTDVDDLVQIGRQNRVVGASFATERRQNEMFDPALQRFSRGMAKAVPDKPLVSIIDASADEQSLLLWAGSDSDPGSFYLYTRADKHLTEVLPVRAELATRQRASVKPVSYPAADGTMIPGYLTLPPGSDGKNLPAIVLPHGGPAARDEWAFDWLPQFFAARGYAVLQPNYRGSSGYGDGWYQKNGFKSWRTAISDVNDGGRWLEKSGIAAPGKLAIVGWSYGGYAALQRAVLDPDLFKAIVAVAPVTDLEILRSESERYLNHAIMDKFIGKGPHIEEGSSARHAAAITAPVLLFHGDQDQNVGVRESRIMAARLKSAGRSVDYVEYKGLDHYLDDGGVRAELLDRADSFLGRALAIK